MAEFLQNLSLFPLVLTLGAYQFGLWCQKKGKSPIFNPILIAVIVVIGVLLLFGIDLEQYQAGNKVITWLLTPATVCLALPLYQQIKVLKKNLPAIFAGIAAGTLSCLGFILLFCALFRLDTAISISLLPKSITTAIGMELSEKNGGLAALTTAAILITGILGNLAAPMLCKLFRFHDPVTQGVAIGTSAHALGTARANEMGAIQGAASSLSLVIAGVLTVILFPFACMLL